MTRRRHMPPSRAARRGAYVLLETVLATGLLIVGLAVIGAQVQSAETSIHTMDQKVRAMDLAEQQMAQLDMGLVKLDSLEQVEKGDFGPRYPDWAWLMTTEKTAIDQMYRLRLDIYYHQREGDYRIDDFDYDAAQDIFTSYAFRAQPRPIDFGTDFGMTDDQLSDMTSKLIDTGIPGLDPTQFDVSLIPKLPFDQFIAVLPTILDAFGIDFDQLASALPRDVLQQLKDSGLLDNGNDSNKEDTQGGQQGQDQQGGQQGQAQQGGKQDQDQQGQPDQDQQGQPDQDQGTKGNNGRTGGTP